MKTSIIFSVLLAGGMIYGGYYMTSSAPTGSAQIVNNSASQRKAVADADAVSMDSSGKQIITITAGRGYFPQSVTAKAGIPTIIRMVSDGSYSCASFLVIPSLGFQGNLSSSVPTDIPVLAQKEGNVIRGTCAMGMYSFSIQFE